METIPHREHARKRKLSLSADPTVSAAVGAKMKPVYIDVWRRVWFTTRAKFICGAEIGDSWSNAIGKA
jgi:hypothetical protein